MDNTKLIERARRYVGDLFSPGAQIVLDLAEALEAAEAALKFKQGLIDDISRDCEPAESELGRRS